MFCFFFFQAEDGIRGVAVTGVQTCALPILRFLRDGQSPPPALLRSRPVCSWLAARRVRPARSPHSKTSRTQRAFPESPFCFQQRGPCSSGRYRLVFPDEEREQTSKRRSPEPANLSCLRLRVQLRRARVLRQSRELLGTTRHPCRTTRVDW